MPIYAYKGVNAAGRNTRGHLDAENLRGARVRLRRDGIYPTEISEGRGDAPGEARAGKRPQLNLSSFQRVRRDPPADISHRLSQSEVFHKIIPSCPAG